jgi:hypothetical protein
MFVLKSRFNGAWSLFNIHDLGRIVVTSWLEYLADLTSATSDLMTLVTGKRDRGPPMVVDLVTGTATFDLRPVT